MSSKEWIPFVAANLSVNSAGILELAGCDLQKIANKYGTPVYIYDEDALRRQCQRYAKAGQNYRPGVEAFYAAKAFLPLAMAELVNEEGLGIDVMSGGELYTALKAGVSPKRIYFNGNNKSPQELREAIEAGLGCIIVDNFFELELVGDLAQQAGITQPIQLRINPGVEAHTHEYIQTGQLDSKFGFPLLGEVAHRAAQVAISHPNLNLLGFHCHIGSQIFALDSYAAAVKTMLEFATEVKRQTGYTWEELNLGGGLGIRYTEEDTPKTAEELVANIISFVSTGCAEYNLPLPKILLEPGRSIVGETGLTLYTIGSIKTIPGIRTYVAVDGGMPDNPRVALYQAKYSAVIVNKADQKPNTLVSVAGKCCESGDMLIWDILLATPESGDLLALFSTGAYTYSMASNYNRLPKPPVVFCSNGTDRLVVRRETYQDLLACELSLKPGRLA